MTVQELIEKLQALPDKDKSRVVGVWSPHGGGIFTIDASSPFARRDPGTSWATVPMLVIFGDDE